MNMILWYIDEAGVFPNEPYAVVGGYGINDEKYDEMQNNFREFKKKYLGSASFKIDMKGFASSYTMVAQFIASLLSEEAITDIELNKINSLSTGLLELDMKILFDKNKFLLNK